MLGKSTLIGTVAALCLSMSPGLARTPRHTVRWGTGPNGRWGVVVRKATPTNRNIRVRFANGENPVLEVPMKAVVREDGKKASIHDLDNGERVHVWTMRSKRGEAMQAWRIYGYSKAYMASRNYMARRR